MVQGIVGIVSGDAVGECLLYPQAHIIVAESGRSILRVGDGNEPVRIVICVADCPGGSVAATTGWVRLKIIVNSAGTSVEYFINGTSVGSSTTNIPTVGMSVAVGIDHGAGGGHT